MSMPLESPKRCPFCGSAKTEMMMSYSPGGHRYDLYLKCLYCQATGPRFNQTAVIAIERWNAEWARDVGQEVPNA